MISKRSELLVVPFFLVLINFFFIQSTHGLTQHMYDNWEDMSHANTRHGTLTNHRNVLSQVITTQHSLGPLNHSDCLLVYLLYVIHPLLMNPHSFFMMTSIDPQMMVALVLVLKSVFLLSIGSGPNFRQNLTTSFVNYFLVMHINPHEASNHK